MGLFDFLKKKGMMIGAPMNGECVEISKVNDPTFSSGMLGQGIAIIPADGKVVAPVDGTVNMVFPTGHAVAFTSDEGTELLIHVGLDTVKLEGKHFTILAEAGQKVKKGDLLVEADIAAIKAEGYDCITPVLVSNTDAYAEVKALTGKTVTAGDDVMELIKK